jgi:hypothetical protein
VAFVFLGFVWIVVMAKRLRRLQELPLTEWLVVKRPNSVENSDDAMLENKARLASSMEAL